MDVVRTVLDRLKGTVQVISHPGQGTTIQLRVPLTLASIQNAASSAWVAAISRANFLCVEITRASVKRFTA